VPRASADSFGPVPPPDVASRTLPVTPVPAESYLARIHWTANAPLFFGPGPGKRPSGRFDALKHEYGTCYFGLSVAVAFAEAMSRSVPPREVSRAGCAARSLVVVQAVRPIMAVQLHGPGLRRLGATGAVSAGAYSRSRMWALALWEHPDQPDGILYRSKHDNDELCLALFDRARDAIQVVHGEPLLTDERRLAALLRRYDVALGP